MRGFFAFLKKELLENYRSGKIFLVLGLFVLFGAMNPAVAKLTPLLLEAFSDILAQSGMSVSSVSVSAFDSWAQFFKNMPMALIAFILIYSGMFTSEYSSGTLVLMLTKGLSRCKVVLSKAVLMISVWTLGYWLSFAVTYFGNELFWDNSEVQSLASAIICWWLFGLCSVCLCVLFSVIFKNYIGVLLGTGGSVLLMYIVSIIPKVDKFIPIYITNGMPLLYGTEELGEYTGAIIVTAVICALSLVLSIPIMNKRDI